MAKRLETQYVKACLQLSEAEMLKFMQLFAEHQIVLQIKVFENGNQELFFKDKDANEELVLSFERKLGMYVSDCSCRLNNPKLANIMRQAISMFKGDAIVNRIYSNYTMVYHYDKGTVVKIIEATEYQHKIIYEYKNTLEKMEKVFLKQNVEKQIEFIYMKIDSLLDQRNQTQNKNLQVEIDQQLERLNYKLFVLEA